MLSNIVYQNIALSTETIVDIRCTDGGAVPLVRETRMDDATTAESIGAYAIEPFYQRTCRRTDTVGIVTSLSTVHHIKLACLFKVTW